MKDNSKMLSDDVIKNTETSCSNTRCCPPKKPITRSIPKVGRNDPCVCGNGRKYKKCCGKSV